MVSLACYVTDECDFDVVRWLFNGCSMVVRWLFNGCSMVVQWLFDGCSMVV